MAVRRALVVGGGGIGAALPPLLAQQLRTETTVVTRRRGSVEWRQQGPEETPMMSARPMSLGLDVMDERSVADFFARLRVERKEEDGGKAFDLVVVATGGLEIERKARDDDDADVSSAMARGRVFGPERQLAELDPEAMMLQVQYARMWKRWGRAEDPGLRVGTLTRC